jgi:hypothetical protein
MPSSAIRHRWSSCERAYYTIRHIPVSRFRLRLTLLPDSNLLVISTYLIRDVVHGHHGMSYKKRFGLFGVPVGLPLDVLCD